MNETRWRWVVSGVVLLGAGRGAETTRAGDDGPMQVFMHSMRDADWPADIATSHDEHLVRAYTDRH